MISVLIADDHGIVREGMCRLLESHPDIRLCAQAADGHRVHFASAGGRFVPLLERSGVRHVELEQSLRNPARTVRAAASLAALCRRERPDVLHAHMMSGAVLGRIAGTLLGIPLVTTVHNSFDRHAWLMRLGDRAVAVSRAERGLHEVTRAMRGSPWDSTATGPPAPDPPVMAGAPPRPGAGRPGRASAAAPAPRSPAGRGHRPRRWPRQPSRRWCPPPPSP